MIPRLAELNRVLVEARDLRDSRGRVTVTALVRQCASRAIEGQLPDHLATIEFALTIGYLVRSRNSVLLTNTAHVFLSLNPTDSYDLTVDQQRLMIRSLYFNGPFREAVLDVIRTFSPAFERRTYRWSALEGTALRGDG